MLKKCVIISSLCLPILTSCAEMNIAAALQAGNSLFQAATLSNKDLHDLGIASAKQLDAEHHIAGKNHPYTKRVEKLTRHLKKYQGLSLNYKVYLEKEVNAFALPNGDIRIYAGLLDKMTDEEVLFVLGHEIGHVVEGHAKSQLRTNLLTTAAREAAMATGDPLISSLSSGEIGQLAHGLIDAQYSQSQEYDADKFGVKVLKEQGTSKTAAVSALQKLASMSEADASIFSSHPDSAKRAERIAKMK